MAKPITHAISSAKTFGGEPEDYIDIHDFMDSSKGVVGDNRHRVLTHNAWFIGPNGPLEKAFGKTVENSEGSQVPVREVGEQHILEDLKGKFIPTVQDYIQAMDIEDWMQNGQGTPPSDERLEEDREEDSLDSMEREKIEQRFEQIQAQLKDLATPIRGMVTDVILQQVERVFDEVDDSVVAFRWAQFTPYFNDGQPCSFGVYVDEPEFYTTLTEDEIHDIHYLGGVAEGHFGDQVGEYELPEGNWVEWSRTKEKREGEWVQVPSQLGGTQDAIRDMMNELTGDEIDPFELAFGDHKEVVVVKLDDGVALETFEYSDHH